MRTPPLVTLVLFLGTLADACAAAQDPVVPGPADPRPRGLPDQQITVVGRDDAALALPLPWQPAPHAFPLPDMQRLETPLSQPFQPLLGDWAGFLPEAGYTYIGCAGAPPGHPPRGECAGWPGGTEFHGV